MNRQGNAKQKIKDAFLSIYSEKDLNQITIRDITNYAGVYRGTFYYYYADIFDLLEDIEKDMKATAIKELIPIIKSLLNGKVTHRDLVFIENFYTKYEKRIKLFLIKKPNLKLIDFMKASIKKTILENFSLTESSLPEEFHYITEFMVSGQISIIRMWLKENRALDVERLHEAIKICTQEFIAYTSSL